METEDADASEDLAKLNKFDKDSYHTYILELQKEQTEILDEIEEEIKAMLNAKRVLLSEKTRLLEKTQDLEEKYSDIRQRHDIKTDMVGKLSIKSFILMTEIDKLTKK